MADPTITPANVKLPDGTARLIRSPSRGSGTGGSGEALLPGQSVFKSASIDPGKWFMLDVDNPTLMADISTSEDSIGILFAGGASTDDPVQVVVYGNIELGAVLTNRVPYFGSGAAGGLSPAADLATSDVGVLMGLATSTSILRVNPVNFEDVLT